MSLQALQVVVVVSLDRRVLDRTVHPFGLAIIRYEIGGASWSGCSRKERTIWRAHLGHGAPGARRCGQAADRQWEVSPDLISTVTDAVLETVGE
jgi:hypothetical protein